MRSSSTRKDVALEKAVDVKPKQPRSIKNKEGNVGEIRQTPYRASLNGIRTLMGELKLTVDHKRIMKKTPFWPIFKAIINAQLTQELCRKSDNMIIRVINAYDPETDGFKMGQNIIRLTRADIAGIFGIRGGSEKVNVLYGAREGVDMVKKRRINQTRLTSFSLKELIKTHAMSNEQEDMEDFVRLLCAYILHSLFFPTGSTVKWVCLERVEDLEGLGEYDWNGAILDVLMTSIRQHYHEPRAVTGCVIVLLVRFFSIVVLHHYEYIILNGTHI